jgi:hypothetical protein
MKTIVKTIIFLVLIISLASCSTFSPKPTETPIPTITSLPTSIPTHTHEPIPTLLPSPTSSALEEKPSINFGVVAFVYNSDLLNATIEIPLGWEAKDNENIGGVFVVDNWINFTQGDPFGDAISILFVDMKKEKASASSSLDFIEGNLGNAITKKLGKTNIEKQDDLEIAWAEYTAKPPADGNGSESYYLLAVITNGKQSISALTTVYLDRQDKVKPIVLEIIKRVKFR